MTRVAICIRGAVAKTSGKFELPDQIYIKSSYINYKSVYNSIKRHVIDANKECSFDFFIQCWNTDLEKELVELYNPKSHSFEDNNLYKDEILTNLHITERPKKDFGITSHLLAISKSIKLLENYVKMNSVSYDYVIIYRPDVLLLKDMNLNLYDKDKIYVNAHPGCGGDFHFIMNLENSYLFGNIYETTKTINEVTKHGVHEKMKIYIEQFMKQKVYMDDIIPGIHQEVVRQLKYCCIDRHGIPYEKLYEYGLTFEEIQQYTSI